MVKGSFENPNDVRGLSSHEVRPLVGWRPKPSQLAGRAKRMGAAAVLFSILILFVTLLYLPFERRQIQFAILAPDLPVPGSLHSIDEIDLASIVAAQNASQVQDAIAATNPMILVPDGRVTLVHGHDWIIQEQVDRTAKRATLFLYASGVLALGSDPGLCLHSHDAMHANHCLKLIPFIRSLRSLRCQQIVLCIDATVPTIDSAGKLSTLPSWEILKTKIERELMQGDSTPIAVLAHIHELPVQPSTSVGSNMASSLVALMKEPRWQKGITLADIQSRLTNPSGRKDQALQSRFSSWLISANWRMDDRERPLPKIPVIATTSLTETQSDANSPLSTWTLDDSTPKRLLDCPPQSFPHFFDAVLEAWRIPSPPQLIPELFLETPLRRLDIEPLAYAQLQSQLDRLQTAIQVAPDAFSPDDLRRLALGVWSIHTHTKVAPDAPKWLKDIANTSQKSGLPASPSLIANLVLAPHGVSQVDRNKETKLLADWYQALEKSETSSAFANYLASLPVESNGWLEFKWANAILANLDVDWPLLRLALQTKLLSHRLMCDPLAILHGGREVQEGERLRGLAERLLTDRSTANWRDEAKDHFHHALSIFRESAQRMELACQRDQTTLDRWVHRSWKTTLEPSSNRDLGSSPNSMDEIRQRILDRDQEAMIALEDWNPEFAKTWKQHSIETIEELSIHTSDHLDPSHIEKQLEVLKRYSSKIHQQTSTIERSLGVESSNVSRVSPFWYWISEMMEGPHHSLNQRYVATPTLIERTLGSNLVRLGKSRIEATDDEWLQLEHELRWWQTLSAKSVLHEGENSGVNSLKIECDPQLDLRLDQTAETRLQVRLATHSTIPVQVQVDYDQESFELQVQGMPWSSKKVWDLTEQVGSQREWSVPVSIRKKKNQSSDRPIVFVARNGSEARRAIMNVQSPARELLVATFHNSAILETDPQHADSRSNRLLCNQNNAIECSLQNRSSASWSGSCQLYRVAKLPKSIPSGTLSLEDASRFLESIPGLTTIAQVPVVGLAAGENKPLPFVPAPPPPQPLDSSFASLLLEARSPDLKAVQFFAWTPSVIHPQSYVECEARGDADRQMITVDLRLREGQALPRLDSHLQVELRNAADLQVLSTTGMTLHSNRPHGQLRLSTIRCPSKDVLVCISVDGWKYSHIFRADLSESGPFLSDPTFAGLLLQPVSDLSVVSPSQSTVQVQLQAILCEIGSTTSADRILIGLDRNADRELEDDPSLEIRQPQSVKFDWQGVTPDGHFSVLTRVEDHQLSLPIDTERNRWVNALAVLERGNLKRYSNLLPFALDTSLPSIRSTRLLGPQPVVLGTPLQIEVEVDDAGLSGVGLVEGGWSLTGDLSIGDTMTRLPAIFRDRNRWLLTLPTAPLPSGKSLVLLRATDRAGNVGEPVSMTVEVLTQEEIDQRNASFSTQVRGRVHYYDLPLTNITVQLLKIPKAVEPGKPPMEAEEVAYSSVTTADGKFFLDEVRTGDYILECRGIVRGTRESRRQNVKIDAKTGPFEFPVQWNKKP